MNIAFAADTTDDTIVLQRLEGWTVGVFTKDDDAEPIEGEIVTVDTADLDHWVTINTAGQGGADVSAETVQDVLVGHARRGDLNDPAQTDLCVLAQRLMRKADEAWNALTEARDDLTEAYERGKAHAFCEALGDQEAISMLIDHRT